MRSSETITLADFLKLQKHNREQLASLAPQVLQHRKGWHGPLQHPGILPVIFMRLADQLKVLASIERKPDQRDWLHVSFSYEYKLPDYETIKEVRELFFPDNATVIQVFPPKAEHVNLSEVLHLWQRIGDNALLPDLRVYDPGWDILGV